MKHARNIFIINPKYQYKTSLIICSFVFLGSLIYPLTIYDLFEKFIATQPDAAEQYAQGRANLLTLLTITELAFIGIVFVISIFLSHKVAGPMYKLQSHLRNIRETGIIKDVYFRDGDNFTEVADDLNETLQYIKDQQEEDQQYLQEVSAFIQNISLGLPDDKKPIIREIQANLVKIQNRFNEHKE